MFLNGRTLTSGQGLKPGEHLAQIVCPDDGLQSRWTTFEEPLDWFSMCPSGVDTTSASEEEDMFGGFAGPSLENTAQYYNPAPVCPASGFVLSSLSLPTVTFPDVEPKVLVTMGSGMSLVLAGVGSYYAWVTPTFNKVLEAWKFSSDTVYQSVEARKILGSLIQRWCNLGLLATGTGLTGYGTILTMQQVSMTLFGSRLGRNKRTF